MNKSNLHPDRHPLDAMLMAMFHFDNWSVSINDEIGEKISPTTGLWNAVHLFQNHTLVSAGEIVNLMSNE